MKYLLIVMILWAGVAQADFSVAGLNIRVINNVAADTNVEDLICLSEKELAGTVAEAIWAIEYLLPEDNQPTGFMDAACNPCRCGSNAECYEWMAEEEREKERAIERIKNLLTHLKGS